MNKVRMTTTVIGFIIAGAFSLPAVSRDKVAEAQIATIENIIANAQTTEVALKYFDPAIVMYDMTPPTFNGRAEVEAHVTQLLAYLKHFHTDILAMRVESDGVLGFANSTQHVVVRDDSGSVTLDAVLRVTECYHKVQGHWLVVASHGSLPVDLATGKMILDSK